jgi:hypothetical protein
MSGQDIESRSQRLHDLHGVHASFHSILTLLKNGYRFDDEDAPAAIEQLEKALARLGTEIRELESEWKGNS